MLFNVLSVCICQHRKSHVYSVFNCLMIVLLLQELNLPLDVSAWSQDDLKDPKKLYEMTVLLNAQREIAEKILDAQWETQWRQKKVHVFLGIYFPSFGQLFSFQFQVWCSTETFLFNLGIKTVNLVGETSHILESNFLIVTLVGLSFIIRFILQGPFSTS